MEVLSLRAAHARRMTVDRNNARVSTVQVSLVVNKHAMVTMHAVVRENS